MQSWHSPTHIGGLHLHAIPRRLAWLSKQALVGRQFLSFSFGFPAHHERCRANRGLSNPNATAAIRHSLYSSIVWDLLRLLSLGVQGDGAAAGLCGNSQVI